jgi:WD40 repeat protein
MGLRNRLIVLILGGVSFCGTGRAQNQSSKPGVVIPPDRLEIMPFEPLSIRALVTKPQPITGAVSWSLETRRHRGGFWCQALSPDGRALATGGLDGTIRIWDVETGRLDRALIGHNSYVYGLDWSPDGNTLASAGSFDATVRLWDAQTGRPLRILRGHPAYVVSVKWSPDGRSVLAAGGESGALSHWDVLSAKKPRVLEIGQPILGLSWRADNRSAAVVAQALPLQIWDAEKNKVLRTFGKVSDGYQSVAWAPDGKSLVAGTGKNTLLYDPDGKVMRTLATPASAVAWSVDGKQLFTLSDAIKVWDATGALLKTIPTPGARTFSATPDAALFVTGGDPIFSVHEAASGKTLRSFDIAGTMPPLWWPGKPLVTGFGTTKLSLWDPVSGKFLRSLEGHTAGITAVTFGPDGKTLATASHDKTVRLWEYATGKLTQTFTGHATYVQAVAFSANGKLIASAGADKKALVWDAKSAKTLATLVGHDSDVSGLAWEPGSSTTVASCGREGEVRIWNARTGKSLTTLKGITEMLSLSWSPDAKYMAGGQADGRVQIWQISSAKRLTLFEGGSPPQASAVAWSPNGQILASGRGNHTMQLWNPKTGKTFFSLQTMAPVQRVSWTPGSSIVVASNHDRTARFFDASTGKVRGVLLAEDKQIMAVHHDGHYRAPNPEAELVYVVLTYKTQETYTPSKFASRFKFKNSPLKVKLTGK